MNVLIAIQRQALKGSSRIYAAVSIISFVVFVSAIVFGFVPVSEQLEKSGYGTADLQSAGSRAKVDTILAAWEGGHMSTALKLTIWDYVFIIAGFLLFTSLNSMFICRFYNWRKWAYVPATGIIFTILSRTADALENLWTLLVYANPEDYSLILISLMKYTGLIKWGLVGLEYTTLAFGLVLVIAARIKPTH